MAPVEVTDDYYAILEVHQTASEMEIKKSYRRLAILRHPDKNLNTPEATASFQLLSTAYETLQNPTSRRTYDIKWPSITKTYRKAQENEYATKVEREKSVEENAAREAEEQMSSFTTDDLQHKAAEEFGKGWWQWREQEQQRRREEKEAEEAREKEQRRKETIARAELEELDPEVLFYIYANYGRSSPAPNRAKSPTAPSSGSTHLPPCSHKDWWNKVESGSLVCMSCNVRCWKYVLECPTCQMRACAECRPVMQGRPPRRPQ